MVTLVKDHGLQYLLAATVLAGLMQIAAGFLQVGYLMRFISKSVLVLARLRPCCAKMELSKQCRVLKKMLT